jgi:tellurite methyltransferase
VTGDVAAAKTEDRSGHETDETDEDTGEQRLSQRPIIPPSPFVMDWIAREAVDGVHGVPVRRRALDVAMGRGRHTLPLARAGYRTFGVDVKFDAVHDASRAALDAGTPIRAWCADLTAHPLPAARFELVVVTRYLQRDLFPAIRESLVPDGLVLYETFTSRQLALGVGPTSPDHLLREGELRTYFEGFEILFYEEVLSPAAVARLAARKRS